MDDEDEVDVEGDFDMNIGGDHEALPNLYLDMNEPPSKSVNLLPEYTQHPWMLEQGWSLDHCTDEKSKAAIEKMLQEEQQYMNGRVTVTKVMTTTQTPASIQKQQLQQQPQRSHPQVQRRAWTEEERQTFQKGLDIYGRSWSRIAELIPDKTTQQVKSFGQHYFKIKAREEEDRYKKEHKPIVKTQLPIGIQHAIRAVTTAQPTVKVSPTKLSTYYDSASLVWTTPHSDFVLPLPASKARKVAGKTTSKRVSPPKGRRGRPPGRPPKPKEVPNRVTKPKLGDDSAVAVKTEPELSSLIANAEVVRIPRIEDSDIDVDVDVDVDSDDDMNVGGEVGDTVYRALVESAGIAPHPVNNGVVEARGTGHRNDSSASSSEAESESRSEADDLDVAVGGKVAMEDTKPAEAVIKCLVGEAALPVCDLLPRCVAESVEGRDRPGLYGVLPHAPPEQLLNESEESIEEPQAPSLVEGEAAQSKADEHGSNHTGDTSDKDDDVTKMVTSHTDTDDYSHSDDDDSDAHPNEFGILTSLGELVWLANPVAAVTLPRDVTSDEEQRIHSEFFSQRPGTKTPDRYLRIRNFILDAWAKCRPQYLNKTSVRPGLRNCGDVNCIGRIHAYLEQVGAINYSCNQVQYLRTCRSVPVKVKHLKDSDQPAVRNDMPTRKRRVRDFEGQWVDKRELEGKTTEHKASVKLEKRQKVARLRLPYDPFKLNTCLNFTQEQPAPFELVVESLAAVTMDVHAHMAKTEVIGLLGGQYAPGEDRLTIMTALPCESLSTGMQCEMDPVSQTEASEAIERQGYVVVGWYHSHPTFTPDPSCRDIETQQKYQDWFGKGGSPFVGVIVSPYCHGQVEARSIIRCLVILNTPPANIGRPYQFEYSLSHAHWDTVRFREEVAHLADRYCTYSSRVHLLQHYTSKSDLTCLQKLVRSLSYSFPESPPEGREHLCHLVEEIITTSYSIDADKGDEELIQMDGDVAAAEGVYDAISDDVERGQEDSEEADGDLAENDFWTPSSNTA